MRPWRFFVSALALLALLIASFHAANAMSTVSDGTTVASSSIRPVLVWVNEVNPDATHLLPLPPPTSATTLAAAASGLGAPLPTPEDEYALAVSTAAGATSFVAVRVRDVRAFHYDAEGADTHDHAEHHHDHSHHAATVGSGALYPGVPATATHMLSAFVPADAISITVLRRGRPHGVARFDSETSVESRGAAALAISAPASAVLTSHQVVDARTQPTVVFVSSGYNSTEEATFTSDVLRALSLLSGSGSAEGMDATPWPRYYSLLNFYSVFEPSVESGAGRLTGELLNCPAEANGCTPQTLDTNLDCNYGTPDPRVLGCNYAKVMALAGAAPAAEVVVVLVNTLVYGGSSSQGYVVVNRGADMELQLLHQLNHAVANLADEFSYGFSATPTTTFPNCRSDGSAWTYWTSQGSADATPSTGCGFDNLVRPTNDSCLMRSKTTAMCAVCREALTLSLLSAKSSSSIAVDLAAPRCPMSGREVHLRDADSIDLSINHIFGASKGSVNVSWTLPSGIVITDVTSLTIVGSTLPSGQSQVTVTVVDDTSLVAPGYRGTGALSSTTVFNLNHVTSLSGCSLTQCTTSQGTVVQYCGACLLTGGCGTSAAANSTVTQPEATLPRAEVNTWRGALGGTIAVTVVALVIVAIVVVWWRRTRVVRVVIFTQCDRIVSIAAVVLLIAVYLAGIATLLVSAYFIPDVPIFTRGMLAAGIGLVAVIMVFCLVGLVAASLRADRGLIATGVALLLISVPVFCASCVGVYAAKNTMTDGVQSWLEDAYKSAVEGSSASLVCDLQNYYQCSGFKASCAAVSATEYCPSACDYGNRYVNPCATRLHDWMNEVLLPGAVALMISAFVVVTAGSMCLVYAWKLHVRLDNGIHRRTYRGDGNVPVHAVSEGEYEALRGEFSKLSGGNPDDGVDGPTALAFMRRALGEEPTPEEEMAVMREATTEGGLPRPVTLDRSLAIFYPNQPIGTVLRDPRTLTEREAGATETAAELVRAHLNKQERYVRICGALSPADLQVIIARFAESGGASAKDSNELFRRIEAAALLAAPSVECQMCRGLTPVELDGLRSFWARIHPAISGDLTDPEIEAFYTASHGVTMRAQEHFIRWKQLLDVRGREAVGWPEFCFPYARRAMNAKARRALLAQSNGNLAALEREYGPLDRSMTPEDVQKEFGAELVAQAILPYEDEVPFARVLAAALAPIISGSAGVSINDTSMLDATEMTTLTRKV